MAEGLPAVGAVLPCIETKVSDSARIKRSEAAGTDGATTLLIFSVLDWGMPSKVGEMINCYIRWQGCLGGRTPNL